jgi:hypothetical protein
MIAKNLFGNIAAGKQIRIISILVLNKLQLNKIIFNLPE